MSLNILRYDFTVSGQNTDTSSYGDSGEQNGINSDCSRIILRRLHYFADFLWERAKEKNR